MSLNVKAIIFDFGGVLLRTHDRSHRTQWDDLLGISHGQFEDYVFNGPVGKAAQLGQATWDDVWVDARTYFDLSPEQTAQSQRDFFKGDTIDVRLADYIRRLKKHYTTGLLSNTWHTNGLSLMIQYGLGDVFHIFVTSAEIGVMKPDPHIYQVALERASAAPAEAIFVDDMEENVLAARNLGMQGVYFVDPDAAIKRLVELTGVS